MKNIKFDHENGYAHTYTDETVENINSRKRGRKRIRFDIIKRDGKMTKVIENITIDELNEYMKIANSQGSCIY